MHLTQAIQEIKHLLTLISLTSCQHLTSSCKLEKTSESRTKTVHLSTKKKTREEVMGKMETQWRRWQQGHKFMLKSVMPEHGIRPLWQGCSREQAGLQSYHAWPSWAGVYASGYWSPKSLLKASCWNSLCHSVPHPTVSYIFSFVFIVCINSKELCKIYLLYLLSSLGSLLPKDLTEEMF